VVYGFRGTRIVIGHGTLILPMLQSYRQLSLESMSRRRRIFIPNRAWPSPWKPWRRSR
jgi:hypothetical protein